MKSAGLGQKRGLRASLSGNPIPFAGFNPANVKDLSGNKLLTQWAFGNGTTGTSGVVDKANTGTPRTPVLPGLYFGNGVTSEVTFGNIGTNVSYFSGWVQLGTTNQELFTLQNSTATAITVSGGVLTAGASLTLSSIQVDGVTKTAAAAGALLNDGNWHFLSFSFGSIAASNTVWFSDGTNLGLILSHDWVFWNSAPTQDELNWFLSFKTLGEAPDTSKMQLWAKCDEQAGTTAYDSSGNGNDGTLSNITHGTDDSLYSYNNQVGYSDGGSGVYIPRDESDPTKDVTGAALDFVGPVPQNPQLINSNCGTADGTGDYVEIADNAAYDITEYLSASARVKNDASALSSNEYFFAKYDSGANAREWAMIVDVDERLAVNFGDPADGTFEGTYRSDSAVTLSAWHQYGFTFNAGTVVLYVDGVAVPGSVSAGAIPSTLHNGTAPVTLFSLLSSGSPGSEWDGNGCDFRIYSGDSAPLTAANMLDLYENGTKDFSGQTLAGGWAVAEGGAGTCFDFSATENHGLINNASLPTFWGTTQDVYHRNITNSFDASYAFIGTSYINYVDDADLDVTAAESFSLVVRVEPDAVTPTRMVGICKAADAVTATNAGWRFYLSAGIVPVFLIADGTTRAFVSLPASAVGEAATYGLSFDRATDTWAAYKNGVFVSSSVSNGPLSAIGSLENTEPVRVGTISAGTSDGFEGHILETKFYKDRVLSAAEHLALYQGQAVDSTGLTLDPDLQALSATSVPDKSGNQSAGTISGAAPGRIPASVGALPTTSNAAGNWHNHAETEIDFDPESTAELAQIYTGGIDLDGTGDQVNFGNVLNETTDAVFTITGLYQTANVATAQIYSKRASRATLADAGYGMDLVSSGTQLVFRISDGTTQPIVASGAAVAPDSTWRHVACVLDLPNERMEIWIDGVLLDDTPSASLAGIGSLSNTEDFLLGAHGGGDNFDGLLRGWKKYPVALTGAQIVADMNGTLPSPASFLAPLDGNALDYSGNDLHGTIEGNPAFPTYTVPNAYAYGDDIDNSKNHFKNSSQDEKEFNFLLYKASLDYNKNLSKVEKFEEIT